MTTLRAILLGLTIGFPFGTCVACAPADRVELEAPGCELRVHFSPETVEAGTAALARINRATGCDIEDVEDGVPVVLRDSMVDAEGDALCGGTTIARWKNGALESVRLVEVTEGHAGCNSLEAIIIHEVIHGMIATNDEHAPDGVFHSHSGHGESLNEASLVTVCSHMACPSFFPEP